MEEYFLHKEGENFTSALWQKDKKLFNDLKEEGVYYYGLDYVPFQFFISVPKNKEEKKKYKGLLSFTNYYDVGQDHGVVSFCTENDVLCNSLENMFRGLVEAQSHKDSEDRNNPVKTTFRTDTASKIKIILKNIIVKKNPEFTTHGEVTTVADSKTKDQLFALFREHDIDFTPEVKFIKESKVGNFLKQEKENYTFLSVGLFFNAVSETIGQLCRELPRDDNFFGSLFKLTDAEMAEDGQTKLKPKGVKVAIAGSTNDKKSINYDDSPHYEEVYSNENSNDKEKFDYAILSKQKINNKWMFTCGGINFFASQHIVDCLTSDVWAKNVEKVRDKEFVAVFKVEDKGKKMPPGIALEFLSVVDDDKKIKRITELS